MEPRAAGDDLCCSAKTRDKKCFWKVMKHVTSPWGSHRWSRYSRRQRDTLWHPGRRLSEETVWRQPGQKRDTSYFMWTKLQSVCAVLTLWTPRVPKGRGLLVLVSMRRTSASSIMLCPPGNAWGMNSLKWATWNKQTQWGQRQAVKLPLNDKVHHSPPDVHHTLFVFLLSTFIWTVLQVYHPSQQKH